MICYVKSPFDVEKCDVRFWYIADVHPIPTVFGCGSFRDGKALDQCVGFTQLPGWVKLLFAT